METEVKNAMKVLTEKITKEVGSLEALQFTQAALNLAHVLQVNAQTAQTQKG